MAGKCGQWLRHSGVTANKNMDILHTTIFTVQPNKWNKYVITVK